jgi:hypothetical protein
MASSIFFGGRLISVPGSYSELDLSGLEQVGLGASGVIAVLGTGEGGRPASTITEVKDLIRMTRPEQFLETFRSGDLFEVGDMLFAPSSDPDVLGGAQEVIAMKVNPDTQGAGVLTNANGDAIDLTTRDYGEFVNQVNIDVASGTTQGKLITIIFEDVTESGDNIGGDNVFTLTYTASGFNTWDTMTAQVISGGSVVCNGTLSEGGSDNEITQLAATDTVEVLSDNVGDNVQTLQVYGQVGGAPIREDLIMDGTTVVSGSTTFDEVYGAILAGGNAVGTITLRRSSAGPTIGTITVGVSRIAARGHTAVYMNGVVTLVSSGASTQNVIIEGKNLSGTVIRELITLTGTTPVAGVASFSEVTVIVHGDVEVAQTITMSGEAARSLGTTHNTVLKAADYFNARNNGVQGFDFTIVTGVTAFEMSNMDIQTAAVDILNPAEPGFLADLYAVVAWINQNSQYLSAAISSGATGGAPDNTAAPLFMTGGSTGTATFTEYQAALNLLKQVDCNTIVALTGDPAVHAAIASHCQYMAGIGRSERDAVLGALNAGFTDVPTKDELKTQIVDINNKYVRLTGQAMERFNRAGERTEFLPPFTAAVAAGMQAGSSVGTSLTYKFANVLSFRQHSTWNPTDDAEEMIQAGALFLENVEGTGRRWVRNITTFLQNNNVANTEASVVEAASTSVRNLRRNLEFAVGKKGFSGTVNATKSIAINTLGLLVDAEILTQWRSLELELVVDVLTVSVEIAPVIPINFIKTTVHLVTVPITA